MVEKNQTALELYNSYKKQYDLLVNIYCQMKKHRPFEPQSKLAKVIWRISRLMEAWKFVAVVNIVKKQKGE